MNTSSRSTPLPAVLAAWLLSACALTAAPTNVVLIVADGVGFDDLACLGSTVHRTPNLDRLASQGMRFTLAYTAGTADSANRAAILTGKNPARLRFTEDLEVPDHGSRKLRPPLQEPNLPLKERTIAEMLRGADFSTAHIGKWHLGGRGFEPEEQGFELNEGGDERAEPASQFSPYGLNHVREQTKREGEYLTDHEAEAAADFIGSHKDRPFFLNYWPYAVHPPWQAPASEVAAFRDKFPPDAAGEKRAIRAAMLFKLDAAVGRILDTLEKQGVAGRTLVIFTSNSGGAMVDGPRASTDTIPRGEAGPPYERGQRVPLVVRWPGVTRPGSTSNIPVISTDLLPTILEATGVPDEAGATNLDGLGLASIMRDAMPRVAREALFWHSPHYGRNGEGPFAAVRSGDWKLIQFYETGRHELYHLAEDPGEERNLAIAQPQRVLDLSRKLFEWQGRVGAQWPMPNPGWEAPAVGVSTDGSIHLPANAAKVHGTVLRYEPQPFKNTLGWWTHAEDWVAWPFLVPKAGRYRLELVMGCGTGSGGSQVAFTVGGSSIEWTVVETGGFQNFTRQVIGEWTIDAGTHTLEVRPVRKPALAVMDLREAVLVPLPLGASK